MDNDTRELSLVELEQVAGGLSWGGIVEAAKGGFGLRTVYREAVKGVTAGIGGWKLANQMYGDKDHSASWSDKWRAMGAMKQYLDGSDKLPSWAPNW
jgi:hypothetical protein